MNIIERLKAAYYVLTSRTFIMFACCNNDQGACCCIGTKRELYNLLNSGHAFVENNDFDNGTA